jgi:hypothetical protein
MTDTTDVYNKLLIELDPYLDLMSKAADTILDEDVSRYPIFGVHQLELDLGLLLIARQDGGAKWSIQVSTLEEMVAKKLIDMEKVNDFRQVYKNPRESLCLFVLSDQGAQFIFLPRKDDYVEEEDQDFRNMR